MSNSIYLREDSDHFLTKCLHLFPNGIPVTTKEPLNDFDTDYKDWGRLSFIGKLKHTLSRVRFGPLFWETLSKAIKPWVLWAFPKKRLYFYLLDSRALDTHQYQAVKRQFFDFPKEVLIELKRDLEAQLGTELTFELTPENMSHCLLTLALNPSDPLDKIPITLEYISTVDKK